MTLHLSLHLVGLVRRVPVNAAVGAFSVVEQDYSLYCLCYCSSLIWVVSFTSYDCSKLTG